QILKHGRRAVAGVAGDVDAYRGDDRIVRAHGDVVVRVVLHLHLLELPVAAIETFGDVDRALPRRAAALLAAEAEARLLRRANEDGGDEAHAGLVVIGLDE